MSQSQGPPYTQADPSPPLRKRKSPELCEPHSDVLEQLNCTEEHLKKLADMMKSLPRADKQSCIFKKLVACDVWKAMGDFYINAGVFSIEDE
jgi:hypothetical protein